MIYSNIIIGPEYAPPKPPQPPPPAQPWLRQCDHQLLERLRDAGSCATWSLLNVVADAQSPRDRTTGRLLRLQLWDRLKRLRGLGLAFTQGRNRVNSSKPDRVARRPAVTLRSRRPTVVESGSVRAVSVRTGTGPQGALSATHEVHRQILSEPPALCRPTIEVEKTESGEEPERISEAASALGRLPRHPKRRWSGWLNDRVRTYRNMRVALPSGEQVYVFGARRGLLVYVREPNLCAGDPDEAGRSWGVVPASSVQVTKNEHAVLLGSQKHGVRECPSALKAISARANGRQPPRAGRRRGRPRRSCIRACP